MKITSTRVRYAAYLLTMIVLHGKAVVHDLHANEMHEIERIRRMPAEQCQADLTRIQAFHAQARNMSEKERHRLFDSFVRDARAEGLGTIPPPPAPCSRVEQAIAECAGVALRCQGEVASL